MKFTRILVLPILLIGLPISLIKLLKEEIDFIATTLMYGYEVNFDRVIDRTKNKLKKVEEAKQRLVDFKATYIG